MATTFRLAKQILVPFRFQKLEYAPLRDSVGFCGANREQEQEKLRNLSLEQALKTEI
jgi:hypothetical protein